MEIESQEEEVEVKRKKKISKVVVNKEEKNLFKDRIEGLLKQIQFDQKRSQKLHWSEFLQLMNHFN